MKNIIFCDNCGRIILDPNDYEINNKYFCNEECEFEYVYGYKLYAV